MQPSTSCVCVVALLSPRCNRPWATSFPYDTVTDVDFTDEDIVKPLLLARLRLIRDAMFDEAWEVLYLAKWVSFYDAWLKAGAEQDREDRARARVRARAQAKAKAKAKAMAVPKAFPKALPKAKVKAMAKAKAKAARLHAGA